jgi:TetR/AcrR family transcriptional repressor of lmrAB and yxaGH operons
MNPQTKGAATKQRMVESMLDLVEVHGYSGTGLNTVLARSGAPKGSLYFHFPEGKEQLGELAVGLAAERFETLIGQALQGAGSGGSTGEIVESVVDGLSHILEESNFTVGCPVSVVALEMGAESERLRTACAQAYATWTVPVAEFLRGRGHAEVEARRMASSIVSLMEGAMIVARAARDVQPLRDAAQTLRILLDLPASATNGSK